MKHALILATLFFAQTLFAATEGEFKLYRDPGHTVTQACDIYTWLKVEEAGGNLTATTKASADGTCVVMVSPKFDTYIAQQQPDDCGSHVFIARDAATGREMFKLVDNSTRVCRDLRPARLEVTLINEKGVRTQLYSQR